MGATPREHVGQIPLPTRNSEAGAECFGRVVLSYLREDDAKPATFFILGDVLHRVIEDTILQDLTEEQTQDAAVLLLDYELGGLGPADVLQSSQRGLDTIYGDAERMIRNWFRFVHPDGDKRHPIYERYQWPPTVEHEFYREDLATYPVWGSVDAIFEAKVEEAINYDTGNGLLVIDWKSGVKRPGSNFQLDYYRFGLQWPEAEAAYHMLDRVQERSIIVPAANPDFTAVKRAIAQAEGQKEAVLDGEMPEFRPDWYCNFCPVQHICPAGGDFRNSVENEAALKACIAEAVPLKYLPEGVDRGYDVSY